MRTMIKSRLMMMIVKNISRLLGGLIRGLELFIQKLNLKILSKLDKTVEIYYPKTIFRKKIKDQHHK